MATIWLLGIEVVGNVLNIIVINLILALVALAFGICYRPLPIRNFKWCSSFQWSLFRKSSSQDYPSGFNNQLDQGYFLHYSD